MARLADMADPHDPAKARLLILTLLKLGGLVLVGLGMLIALRGWLGESSRIAGGALMLAGVVEMWLVPRALLRTWRTPK